jgi:hypothetical protein
MKLFVSHINNEPTPNMLSSLKRYATGPYCPGYSLMTLTECFTPMQINITFAMDFQKIETQHATIPSITATYIR